MIKNHWGGFLSVSMCLLLVFLFSSCHPSKAHECEQLRQAWTPEVRDAFIDMGKSKGCFTLKEVIDKKGRKIGCYGSSSSFDKAKEGWVTICEPLCKREAPECYADGWEPPKPDRCKD